MSKTLDYLNEELMQALPEPWDIRSVRFLSDGWSLKVEIVFTDGEGDHTYQYDVYGNDRSDMRHIAVVAVRKLLADYGG